MTEFYFDRQLKAFTIVYELEGGGTAQMVIGYGTLMKALGFLFERDFPFFETHGRCDRCDKKEEFADERCRGCNKIDPSEGDYGYCPDCDYEDCSVCDRIDPDNPPPGWTYTEPEPMEEEVELKDKEMEEARQNLMIHKLREDKATQAEREEEQSSGI